MSDPLVSVVIPCYNHESFVQDCIQSVVDQTYQNIELIIIDDGSKDNSVAKIKEMISICEARFTRFEFRHRSNKGLSATLNEALEWSKGDFFETLASDDNILVDKISFQVDFFKKNLNIVALFGNVNLIDNNNIIIKTENFPSRYYSFESIFLNKHHINASTQMIKMAALKAVGGFKNGITIEDLYMWLKLSQKGDIFVHNKVLSNYRLHDNNSIKKGEFIYKGTLDVIHEYYRHPLYLKALKKIIWTYAISLALTEKRKSLSFLKVLIGNNILDLFTKDFLRFIRNYYFK
ncbi:glycosyltransferase family 2 protein [Acinetobacter baumannii]|uniref:glycosyltransferase family 2 protein n=2 Tax=Acinetobacter baumannii TaxID=470 RepID=UPI002442E30C|nr:glycosyltransferase family A protein [Acinetobacter baumannii]WGF07223.1 glycosyltransferase family 2 protein [Acinetobacter baumannii]WGF11048.1 glycosyltransferase family 2 protein [Acinetobacter baumannii]